MIELPEKFRNDTNDRFLNINPFIVIGWDVATGYPKQQSLVISTTKESIALSANRTQHPDVLIPGTEDIPQLGPEQFVPLSDIIYDQNLKISSMKESIDFETRRFKINNVSLSFSNFGNFSNFMTDYDIMNETVAVFWKTPSAKDIDDCLLVYEGQIVRYDHDEKTIKLNLEDKTLHKIDKDIPLANLGTSQRVARDKDRNKYIPIAYGRIPYAPAIMYAMTSDEIEQANADDFAGGFEGFYILGDDTMDSMGTNRNIRGKVLSPDGLCINKGGDAGYWNVKAVMTNNRLQTDYPSSYEQVWQHPESEPFAYFCPHWKYDGFGFPGNPIQDNKVECFQKVYPNQTSKRYGYQDPSSPAFNEMGFSNPQYAIDRGTSDLEAQAFSVNPNVSYAEFPDADMDSWNLEESVYPTVDVSNDLSEMLSQSDNGNFLLQDKIEWNDILCAPNNWFYGWLYLYQFDNTDWYKITIHAPPPEYHEVSQGGTSDETYWGKKMKWKVEWNNWNTYATNAPHQTWEGLITGGIFPSSWNFDSDRYLYDFAEDGFYGYSSSSSYDHDGKAYLTESPINKKNNNGSLNDEYIRKYWPRVFDFRNRMIIQTSVGDYSEDEEYDGETGSLAIPYDSGATILQLPNTVKIREAVEDYLGFEVGDPDGEKDLYTFINICDGLMGIRDSSISSSKYTAMNIGWESGSDSVKYEDGVEYPFAPQILAARPYGQMVWFFGYDCATTEGKYYPTKFIAVTFDGELEIQKWNWRNSFDDGYYDYQEITHTLALHNVLNLAEYPVAQIADHSMSSGWGDLGYGSDGGQPMHALENRHALYSDLNETWYNGVNIDNSDIGDPSGECPYDLRSQILGSGIQRWNILFTKNSPWLDGMGLRPGILFSGVNNYEDYTDDAIEGWSNDWFIDYGGYFTGGNINYYLEPIVGYYNFPPGHRVVYDFALPDVGYDDLIEDSLIVFSRYKFTVGTDRTTLQATDANTQIDLSAHRLEMFFIATNRDDVTGDADYGSAGTQKRVIYGDDLLAIIDENDSIVLDNLYNTQTPDIPNEDNYGTDLDGYCGDVFNWDGSGSYNPTDFWNNGGQFNSYSLYVRWLGDFGQTDSDIALPYQNKLYDFHLDMEGTFDNFKGSDFYIENYQGRGHENNAGPIDDPTGVIVDLLYSELGYDGMINTLEQSRAWSNCQGWKLGFSVTKKTNSKKLIEDICSNTPILPRFKGRNEFGFISMARAYDSTNVDKWINDLDVIKFKFTKTKLEKVISSVEVKYDYDYATDSYRETTGWKSAKDLYGDGDLGFTHPVTGLDGYSLGYYNLGQERDLGGYTLRTEIDTSKTIEAKYINDPSTARNLQDFYLAFHCNQHIIIQLELTLAYMNLEVGDIIAFDKLPGNTFAYGMDYTQLNVLNGQIIYPYFIVQEIVKKTDKVMIKVMQLHNLNSNYTPHQGDVSRRGTRVYWVDNQPDDLDKLMIAEYLQNKATSRYSMQQITAMDINGSNSVTYKDLAFWDEWLLAGDEIGPIDHVTPPVPGPDNNATEI